MLKVTKLNYKHGILVKEDGDKIFLSYGNGNIFAIPKRRKQVILDSIDLGLKKLKISKNPIQCFGGRSLFPEILSQRFYGAGEMYMPNDKRKTVTVLMMGNEQSLRVKRTVLIDVLKKLRDYLNEPEYNDYWRILDDL